MPEHSPAQTVPSSCPAEKIYDSRVQDTFVPGLSVFMGSVCQTEMD